MLASNNIFSPANGSPIISPSQDMVLGHLLPDEEPALAPGPPAALLVA